MTQINKIGKITKGEYAGWLAAIDPCPLDGSICLFLAWTVDGKHGFDTQCSLEEAIVYSEKIGVKWTDEDYMPRK